ncbi:low-complexity tail membrane protein [Thermostichus vulcanus]|uniref:Low-complexity tail membrane protein n=1 Tax=Thermostichus vulcanus str. 'Rupite' TaxID=2813851 RepID=A0ABT0CAA9_THEVL|nr:low-complexity tail membrane protein [Thermostichus vulcanus]MCJ2542722.1 low-complexity tail membrane protein [Thermostichus vulcanus str. 'Rupite']
MRKHWQEPFLWIHAAGILVFPLWIGLTLIGLATGDPLFPVGVEQAWVAVVGIVPTFVMQWRKPFNIFSLLVVSIAPKDLTPEQRRILAAFLRPEQKILTVLTAILMLEVCERLYDFAPLFAALTPGTGTRIAGLAIAAFGFWGANLFLQIPVAVARVLLLSEPELAQIEPIPTDQIESQFSVVGSQRTQLLQRLLGWLAWSSPEPTVALAETSDPASTLPTDSSPPRPGSAAPATDAPETTSETPADPA